MSQCKQAAGHQEKDCCPKCHAAWESQGDYMCDGFDSEGYDLHTCCRAAMTSRDFLQKHGVQLKLKPRPRSTDA